MNHADGLTQTQERKLFRELTLGKEHTVQWFQILEVFGDLPEARQKAALRKVSLNAFLSLADVVRTMRESRDGEIKEQKEKAEKLKTFRQMLTDEGITLEELAGVAAPVAPKKEYKKRRDKVAGGMTQPQLDVYNTLAHFTDAQGHVRATHAQIVEHCGLDPKHLSNRLSRLKLLGVITGKLQNGSMVIKPIEAA